VLLLLAACTAGIERSAEVLRSAPPGAEVTASPSHGPSPVPSGTIRILVPHEEDDVLSPVPIRGVAATEQGRVLVRVVDAHGTELSAMNVEIGCGAGCRGRFEARLAFYVPVRQAGAVQALEIGPGGVVVQLAEVPVTLVPGG
jgi:hypothetical protein